jgi:hypothetical protein
VPATGTTSERADREVRVDMAECPAINAPAIRPTVDPCSTASTIPILNVVVQVLSFPPS